MLHYPGSALDVHSSCCEHVNEPLGPQKALYQLWHRWLLKDPASWSWCFVKLLMMPSLVWYWFCRSNQPDQGTLALPADSGIPFIWLDAYQVLPNALCHGHNLFSRISRSITPVIVVSPKTNRPYTVYYDSTQNVSASVSARRTSLGYVRPIFDTCAYLPS